MMYENEPPKRSQPDGYVDKRLEWTQKPGFWDPFIVAQHCITILSGEIHINMKYPKCDIESGKAIPLEPCHGIRIYLKPMADRPDIDEVIQRYIKFPCKDIMKRIVNNDSNNALYFIIHYLRKRGAFIKWKVRHANEAVVKLRHITQSTAAYLHGLAELDFCAATLIGRYLTHTISVAYAHNIHYMTEILAKLWGPLFIKLDPLPDVEKHVTEEMKIKVPIKIFTSMLNAVPWNSFVPFENMTLVIQPSKDMALTHKYNELSDYIVETSTVPKEFEHNMGNLNIIRLEADGIPEDPELSHTELQELRHRPFTTDVAPFPPDKSLINPNEPVESLFRY